MVEELKLYKGEVTIYFNRERHIFSHDKEGKVRIDSVTSATGKLDKSGPLMVWSNREVAKYIIEQMNILPKEYFNVSPKERSETWRNFLVDIKDKKISTTASKMGEIIFSAMKQPYARKKEAADIGTSIHELCEKWIKGKKIDVPEDERIRNGYMAFLKWINDKEKLKITRSEQYIYSRKYDYAGIEDWEGKDNKELVIGDFKSSNGIYSEMHYQLSGYWQAREEETGKQYDKGYIVKFGKEDGEFETLQIPRSEYLKDFKAFLSLLKVKRREKEL